MTIDEQKKLVEEALQEFVSDELFSWGMWDGSDDEIDPQQLARNFTVKFVVETNLSALTTDNK